MPRQAAPEPSSHTFFLIGPPTLHRDGQPLTLSTKGRLLLLYLCLEGRPVHRSTIASLLWPDGDGLRSLRVELSKLRRAGMSLGEDRGPLLSFGADPVLRPAPEAGGPTAELLQGCDRHGSPAFRDWVRQQRLRFAALQTEAAFPEVTPRQRAVTWLARDVHATLTRLQGRAVQTRRMQVLLREHTQNVLPQAALDAALAAQDWRAVTVECGGDHRLFLTALLLRAEALLPERQRRLPQALQGAPDDAALLSRISAALLAHSAPLVLVLQHAARLPEASAALLTLAANWPSPLVLVLLTEGAAPDALTRSLRQVFPPEQLTTLTSARLPSAALNAKDPHAFAWHIQQSEGRWPVLDALLQRPVPPQGRVRLDPPLQQDLLRRLVHTHPQLLAALAPLTMLPGPFPVAQALPLIPTDALDTLRHGLRAGVLQRVPPTLHLNGLEGRVRVADEETPLAFASELTRSALAATLKPSDRRYLRASHPLVPSSAGGGLPAPPPAPRNPALPPEHGAFIRALDLHGGYAADLWTHRLTLYRLGASGHRPVALRLTLPPGTVEAGTELWYQVACLDGAGGSSHLIVGGDDQVLQPGGRWRAVTLPPSGSGQLALHVSAVNLILHIHLHGLSRAFPAWQAVS